MMRGATVSCVHSIASPYWHQERKGGAGLLLLVHGSLNMVCNAAFEKIDIQALVHLWQVLMANGGAILLIFALTLALCVTEVRRVCLIVAHASPPRAQCALPMDGVRVVYTPGFDSLLFARHFDKVKNKRRCKVTANGVTVAMAQLATCDSEGFSEWWQKK